MSLFEKGDTVQVVKDGIVHVSTLKKKEGKWWRLTNKHPKDCCNYWPEEKLILISKRK